jgi:hypothetical protein
MFGSPNSRRAPDAAKAILAHFTPRPVEPEPPVTVAITVDPIFTGTTVTINGVVYVPKEER